MFENALVAVSQEVDSMRWIEQSSGGLKDNPPALAFAKLITTKLPCEFLFRTTTSEGDTLCHNRN